MSQYKDELRSSWYCKFSYQDWTGQRRQKLKRGFPTKREAAAWERNFLEKQQGTPDMTFQTLYELYAADLENHAKESTRRSRLSTIKNHLLPFWKDKKLTEITPADIRSWQNEIDVYKRQPHGPAYRINSLFIPHTRKCTDLQESLRPFLFLGFITIYFL